MSDIKNREVLLTEGQTLVVRANRSDFHASYEDVALIVLTYIVDQARPPHPRAASIPPIKSTPSSLVSKSSDLVPSDKNEVFLEKGQTLLLRANGSDFHMSHEDISMAFYIRIINQGRPPRPSSEAQASSSPPLRYVPRS